MASNPFDIPQQLRDTAERNVEQAKEAFEQFIDATGKAVAAGEDTSQVVSEGTADVGRKAVTFMEDNVAATFDLARRIVQARTVEEITALQQEYMRRQAASLAKQGQDLGGMMTRMASDASKKTEK